MRWQEARFAVLVLTVLVFLFGCGGKTTVEISEQKVSLSYGTLGGKEVSYKMSSNTSYNFQGVERQTLSEITYSVKVDSIYPDGTIDRTIKFLDFVMSEIGGSTGKLETATDLEKYRGEWLYLRLGPEGKLLNWKGLDGITEHDLTGESFRDQLVLSMAELYQPLGGGEVGVGSTWHREIELPMGIRDGEKTQKVSLEYEVEGFGKKDGRRCAKIKIRTKIEAEGGGEIRGKKFWVNLSGNGSGTIWFDYTEGLLVEEYSKAVVTVDVSRERAGKEDVTTDTGTLDVESKVHLIK